MLFGHNLGQMSSGPHGPILVFTTSHLQTSDESQQVSMIPVTPLKELGERQLYLWHQFYVKLQKYYAKKKQKHF